MRKINNPALRNHAQSLRRAMTKEERHLWYDFLKNIPIPVHRQKVIGTYILDFYIPSRKLAIELDGGNHFSYSSQRYDDRRSAYLHDLGITVLRYSNSCVEKHFCDVCYDISKHLDLPSEKF